MFNLIKEYQCRHLVKKALLFSALLSLAACDFLGKSSESTKTDAEQPSLTVGVLISNGTANPFFKEAYQAFQTYGKEHPNITILPHDAQDDHSQQMIALDNLINRGAKAIIINMVDAHKADEVFSRVQRFHIPVVFFNRSPGQQKLFDYKESLFVDGDAVQGGILQGLAVLKAWKSHPEWDKNHDGKIQFAMLKGIEGNPSAEARTNWSISTMSSYPNLFVPSEQIDLQVANFKTEQARNITNDWFESSLGSRIEVIMANNDSMAIGALQAIESKGIMLPIFGIDAIPEARRLVSQGKLADSVINDAKTQAEVSIQSAINLSQAKVANEGMSYRLDYQVIRVPYKSL